MYISSTIKIVWHGHACVSIESSGAVLVIDPHDGASIGLRRPEVKADYVLVTHDHFDHNAVSVVAKRETTVFKMREGDFVLGPFRVRGVKTFHDKERGRRRGLNIVYRVTSPGGLGILHGGDLGHVPGQEIVRELTPIDIAILPVGGTFTIDYREALETFDLVGARVLIPIHYWVKGVNLPLSPIDPFIEEAKRRGLEIIEKGDNIYETIDDRKGLPEKRSVVILKYS